MASPKSRPLRCCFVLQTGRTLTSDLLDQAADPQRWLALHGAPLPTPQTHADKGNPAGSQSPASQLQASPHQQQPQAQAKQQQQQSPVQHQQARQAASFDPFADALPVQFRAEGAAQPAQQQQWWQNGEHNQQANPFDEFSQPFRPRLPAVATAAGGSTQGGHVDQELGGLSLHEHSPLQQQQQQQHDSRQSLLDDMLMPPPAPRPPKPLQHHQSMPRGALPRPKSSLKRYTDIPSHAPTNHAPSSHSYQPTAFGHDSLAGASASAPSALPVLANPFAQSSFGDISLSHPNAPMLRVQRTEMSPSASPSSSPTKGRPEGHADAPLAFDARLPPLHPKLSAQLTLLAAGHGSIFAGPSSTGFGLLQWARPEGNMRQPKGANSR